MSKVAGANLLRGTFDKFSISSGFLGDRACLEVFDFFFLAPWGATVLYAQTRKRPPEDIHRRVYFCTRPSFFSNFG